MVLNRALLHAVMACFVLAAVPAIAHRPATPLQPMHGGEVEQVGQTRVELVLQDGLVHVYARDLQDDPVQLLSAQLKAWTASGMQVVPLRISYDHAVGSVDPALDGQRYLVKIHLSLGQVHRLIFSN